ncbi:hypothetical protein INR75_02885 [Zunongwangia sp. SCSIO 43204]|uniref:hypothetical protein n=1 Tax=Zunongwangia sp. SCSIO 43204 TaxID=2779359 RepID=UPI001CA92636|nr:hypothetical protein [Zunongwangia sp. SCSIO 43204]UAB84992.1 hypothetical protein INR75_02885 [Zunongwangia sp. SCSIO 43204]
MGIFNRKPKQKSLKQIKAEVTELNKQLLALGYNIENIMEFWEETMAEAEICHNLPPCRCGDPNYCDTWCRAKARFAMNPPD